MSNRKRVSIQLACYTLAQWTAWNGVLLSGQVSIVSDAVGDAVRTKIGDGVTTWTALPYYNPASSSQTLQQTLGFGNTTSGNNLIVTTNDEIYFGGLTKFSQGYDGSTLILQDVASSDGIYLDEGGTGLSLKGGGSALDVRADIDINSAGEIFFTGTFYNFSGLSGNKLTFINNSNHLITTNVVTDNNNLFFPSNYGIDNPTPGDVLNIGGSYASTINIGRAGATVNILGTALYEYAANQYVLDKLITLNYGGAVSSGTGVGFEIEENNVITGYLKTNSSRDGFELLSPAIAYKATLSLASLTANRTLTIPNVDGTLISTGDSGTVTNTMLANSTISGISLGSNLNDLTFGTGLTLDSGTTFNGSAARTLTVSTSVIRSVFKSTTDSSAVTGTTAQTLLTSGLIPAGTLTTGDVIELNARIIKTGTAGTTTTRIYVNTSSTLVGATQLGVVTNAASLIFIAPIRCFLIKSSTNTEGILSSLSVNGDSGGAIAAARTSTNIDWTVDQYIIISIQNSSAADSTLCSWFQLDKK